MRDFPCLAVVSTDSTNEQISEESVRLLFCVTNDDHFEKLFKPKVVPPFVDLQEVRKQMIDFCQAKHRHLCYKSQPLVTGMKLIDCKYDVQFEEDLRLVKAMDCISHPDYIALSYVWGDTQTRNATLLPKTIRDAMAATIELGYQYLWVDKYCTNQQDEIEKEHQINCMDYIYKGAVLTIIASAGSDAQFGLPGIRSKMSTDKDTPRILQPSLRLGDVTIISSMFFPRFVVDSSVWSSRAWTYQEGMLSTRRLVFTEYEVYYECQSMHSREGWIIQKDDLHSHGRFRRFIQPGIFNNRDIGHTRVARSIVHNLSKYRKMTVKYSARAFSEDRGNEDSLRAFAGIMNDFNLGTYPIHQLWGLPFAQDAGKELTYNNTFVTSLLWHHNPNALSREGPRPERRSPFPSWTWAGWSGAIEYPAFGSRRGKLDSHVKNLLLECDHDAIHFTSIPEYCMARDLSYSGFRVIRFEADILDSKCLKFQIGVGGDARNPRTTRIRGFPARIDISDRDITHQHFQHLFQKNNATFILLAAEVPRRHGITTPKRDVRTYFTKNSPVKATYTRSRTKGYLHFLITRSSGDFDARIGTMIVTGDLLSFQKKFEFEKERKVIRLI